MQTVTRGSTPQRWRRRLAGVRHATVRQLPHAAQTLIAGWAPPWSGQVIIPAPDGETVILGSPHAHGLVSRLYWLGPASYEPATVATWWALSRDADVIADVGAHVGYYTVVAHAANPRAMVHAVEPFPDAAGHLREALRLNAIGDRVQLHEVALGSATGDRRFVLPTDQRTGCPRPAGYCPLTQKAPASTQLLQVR